ncbi:MAG: hypothetical protein BIFFINMI_04398 [Phycisphaerae bacterium]|nr:hypothetical protein [Phycisphaerae bacterium]
MRRIHLKSWIVLVALGMCWAASARADTLILKENAVLDGTGNYVYNDVADTKISHSGSDEQYAHGADKAMSVGHGSPATSEAGHYSVSLIRFDLGSYVGATVNSATLRVYQQAGVAATIKAAPMLRDWTEGSLGTSNYGSTFDGASEFAATIGTLVDTSELQSTTHNSTTVYYINNVTDLAVDPNDGVGHYISRADSSVIRNWDIVNRRLNPTADLDDLTTSGTLESYYYDDAGDRIYLLRGDRDIRYFSSTDFWTDSVWDGSKTKGPAASDVDIAAAVNSLSTTTRGWYEWDVTAFVTAWIESGDPNYGLRLFKYIQYSGNNTMATSEQGLKYDPINNVFEGDSAYVEANGIYIQPELVLDITPLAAPEPATLALLAAGGLGMLGGAIRRRRRA